MQQELHIEIINEQYLKGFAPLNGCITETNNTQVDNAKDLDVVMTMYNLIEHSDNYSKKSECSWQYCKDEPNNAITESESFKITSDFLDNTNNAGIIDAKIAVSLNYLNNF